MSQIINPIYEHLYEYDDRQRLDISWGVRRFWSRGHCKHCKEPYRDDEDRKEWTNQMITKHNISARSAGPVFDARYTDDIIHIMYLCHNCWKKDDTRYTWPTDRMIQAVHNFWSQADVNKILEIFKM